MNEPRVRLPSVQFALLCIPVLLGPWLFGAWEMWWFWPFTLCVLLSSLLFGIRLLLPARPSEDGKVPGATRVPSAARQGAVVALLYGIFLLYALVRSLQADVAMDAERSFLLHLTPFLVGIQVLFGLHPRRRRILYVLMAANLFLIGAYGIANHIATGSERVLWEAGYAKYFGEGRASGPYFCPDHFSGIMELALALGLALVLTRASETGWRLAGGGLCCIAAIGVVLSKSRGGGLTVLAVVAAAMVWGFTRWPSRKRWWWRLSWATSAAIALLIFCNTGTGYMKRFTGYFETTADTDAALHDRAVTLVQRARATSRGRMIGGALRAWRDAPLFGIGPGMHQHLWPHYAASSDGNRERGAWPSLPNYDFHSYEVHSDWVQLLEEYGAVGLVLFLLPAGTLFIGLVRSTEYSAMLLGGVLSFVAMGFHSLGDFNLQMPGTTWTLAAILGLAAADVTRRTRRSRRSRPAPVQNVKLDR